MVTIELFGVARLRAGRDAFAIEASSLGEAFRALGAACPALSSSVVEGDRLRPHYIVAINGAILAADPAKPLVDGDVVLVLSADAGG